MRFLPACKLQSYGLYVDWHVLRSCCCVSLLHVRTGVVCLQVARARARPTVMFVGRCGWLPISTVRSRGRTDNPRGLPRTLVASCAQATYVEVELYAYTYTPSLLLQRHVFRSQNKYSARTRIMYSFLFYIYGIFVFRCFIQTNSIQYSN
jgi:hypothetical protein